MVTWFIIIGVIVILAVLGTIRGLYELRTLQTANYEITSEKIAQEDALRLVLLTDLHGRSYGEKNEDLISRIREAKPDLILSAGDMLTASMNLSGFSEGTELFAKLTQIAPVYAAYGNHEKRLSLESGEKHEAFLKYRKEAEKQGVIWLANEGTFVNSSVAVYGLDIDFKYYKKLKRQFYPVDQMKQDLASVRKECFNIVLAHNPRFLKTYADFGADLVLSGHYHGGAIRIAGRIGVVSPQFRPFPRYSRGEYRSKDTTMIVSAGCGSHKVNLRIFNKPEIVVIDIHGNLV